MPLRELMKTTGTVSFVPSSGKQNAPALRYPWVQIVRIMLRQDWNFSSEVAAGKQRKRK